MNKIVDIISARQVFYSLVFVSAVMMACLAPKAAVNVDEQLHYPHAKKVINWYITGGKDTSCLETPETNLKYYGQSVDNFTALVNRIFNVQDEFLTRHVTGAMFFVILLLFAGLIAHQLTGNYRSSVITVLSLILMPRLFGQAFGNLKDIPFATGYLAAIFFMIRFIRGFPKSPWSTAVMLGISIAFTISVRIGGLILFFYTALFSVTYYLLKPFKRKQIFSTKSCLVRLLGQLSAIVIIGYFAGLLFWPFALQDVWTHPFESLQVMEHYKVSIRQIFNGDLTWSSDLPWYYLPKWLLLSTPEFVLVGMAIFAIFFISGGVKKGENNNGFFGEAMVLFAFLFPAIYVVVIDANLYSGVRQVLFLLPVLSILTAVGITKVLKLRPKRLHHRVMAFIFFALMALPLFHQIKTFPVDYVYFNSLTGGNKKAWSNFEYDYYFHAVKKPAGLLTERVKGISEVVVASNCNLSNYFDPYPNITFRYCRYLERSSTDWDYGLFGINYIHPFLLKNNTWQSAETLETYYHKGNPVAVLLKRKEKSDYLGIKALENANFESAKQLLEYSVQKDPNNVWLFVNLAKISLAEKEYENFELTLEKGREIHPYYEPFFMLEAQRQMDEKRYEDADSTLKALFGLNPRYQAAIPLMKELKTKLNR